MQKTLGKLHYGVSNEKEAQIEKYIFSHGTLCLAQSCKASGKVWLLI